MFLTYYIFAVLFSIVFKFNEKYVYVLKLFGQRIKFNNHYVHFIFPYAFLLMFISFFFKDFFVVHIGGKTVVKSLLNGDVYIYSYLYGEVGEEEFLEIYKLSFSDIVDEIVLSSVFQAKLVKTKNGHVLRKKEYKDGKLITLVSYEEMAFKFQKGIKEGKYEE